MGNLISNLKTAYNALSDTKKKLPDNNLYNLIAHNILSGYDFTSELKNLLITDTEEVMSLSNIFSKKVDVCIKLNYSNEKIIETLKKKPYANDEIGIKYSKIHDAFMEYIISKNINFINKQVDEDEQVDGPDNTSDTDISDITDDNSLISTDYELNICDNEYLRTNQLIAINNTIKQNWTSGLHCQIM